MKNPMSLKRAAEFGISATMLSIVLLAACSGGGPGSGFTGSAVKGPVSIATVNIDSNGDGICGGAGDAAPVKTNDQGVFLFPTVTDGIAHSVCAWGGTDTITGADLTGTALLAPPGESPVATPLSTLVVGLVKITGGNVNSEADVASANAKIASALGLTRADVVPATPAAALAVEASANAVQTLLSGTAKIVASVARGSTLGSMYPAAIQGAASAIAGATTTGLTNGATLAITREAILRTVLQAQAEPGAPATIMALSPVMVSEIAAPALAANVEAVSAATPATLQTVVAEANSRMNEAASAMSQISTLTTASFANALGITTGNATAASSLAAAVMNASISGVNAAQSELAAASSSAIAIAAASGVVIPAPTFHLNALVFSNPTVNNIATTTTAPYTVAVAGPLASATLKVAADGSPTLAPTSSAFFKVTEVGGTRELWLFIDQVNITNSNGTITMTAPASAKLYAYGNDGVGLSFAATLANASEVFTSANNTVTLNLTSALTALQTQSPFPNLNLVMKGTFDVTVAINGAALYMTDASGTVPAAAVATTAPPAAGFPNGGSFSGNGIIFRVTVL